MYGKLQFRDREANEHGAYRMSGKGNGVSMSHSRSHHTKRKGFPAWILPAGQRVQDRMIGTDDEGRTVVRNQQETIAYLRWLMSPDPDKEPPPPPSRRSSL